MSESERKSQESSEKSPELQESENIIMDLRIPETFKEALLHLLRGKIPAYYTNCDQKLPDLTAIGIHVLSIEATVETLPASIRQHVLQATGIILPQEEPQRSHAYFIAKDPQVAKLLYDAYCQKNMALIKALTAREDELIEGNKTGTVH